MKLKNKKYLKQTKNITSFKIDISNYEINKFVEGFAVIEDLKTKKEGWINENFTKIIEPIFDKSYNFQNGFGVFERDETFGWMDKTGKILVEGFDICHYFKEGLARFKRDDKWGLINESGNILGEGFDYCWTFKNGFSKFEKNGKLYWIDKTGKIYTEKPY